MKVFLTLLFLVTGSPLSVLGQAKPDTLSWREGVLLQVSDFRMEGEAVNLGITYRYNCRFAGAGFSGTYPLVSGSVVWDRTLSGLGKYTTRNELRYAQLIFDIYGLQSLKTEQRIVELGILPLNQNEANRKLENLFRETDIQYTRERVKLKMEMEGSDGTEDAIDTVLGKWEEKVRSDLAATPRVGVVDSYHWLIGMYIGIGQAFLTGKTREAFTDPTAFNLGLEFDRKKSRVAMDMRLGFNRTRQEVTGKGNWPSGLKTGHAGVEFTYGRKFQKRKQLLVPYIGLAINEFSPRKMDDEDKRSVVGYSPVLGLEWNYIFKEKTNSYERDSFFYKVKLSCSPANLIRNYCGTQVNLTFSVGIDAALRRQRMALR